MAERNLRTPRIALVVGGCFKAIAQHPSIVDAHRVVYIDAYSETDDIASTPDVIAIDLARDETVRSLCARFDRGSNGRPHLRDVQGHLDRVIAIMGCKSVDLAKGLGQVPAVAYLAWQARLEQGLSRTFRAMIDELTNSAEGQLARVEIDVFHSNAGATGRGIANAVVTAICNRLQGRNVSVTHYVVGRMSFTGLGDHVHDNAPLGVLEDIAYQLQPPTQAKAVHRWLGVELPPVGNDVVLRSNYAALWAQAMAAPMTREVLDRDQTNRHAAGAWGGFTLVRGGWFRSTMDEKEVVAGVAQHVLREIDRLLAAGADAQPPLKVSFVPPATEEGEPAYEKAPGAPQESGRAQPAVRELPVDLQKAALEALAGVASAESVRQVVEQGVAQPQPIVRFQRESGEQASASMLFRKPVVSDYEPLLADLRQAQALQSAIARALNRENEALSETGELCRAVERAKENLQRTIGLLCPRRIDQQMQALWHPANRRRLAFLNAAITYRRLASQKAEHVARQAALQELSDRATGLIRATQEPFEVIRRALVRLLGQQPPPIDNRLVGFRSLSERVRGRQTIFEALLRAARTENTYRLYHELRLAARGVTLQGLASILKLPPDADALAVVNKLDSEGGEMGPYWGGMPRPDVDVHQRIRVLPPLEGDLLRTLDQAREQIESHIHLVCADSMAGGIGVVRLDTYVVEEWSDLLTPEYQQDLLATLGDTNTFALAHVPGHPLYLDGILEALHHTPASDVERLLSQARPRPVAVPEPDAP